LRASSRALARLLVRPWCEIAKSFSPGIAVVKLQRSLAALVPAKSATAAGLLDEPGLHPPAPGGDAFLPALLAAVAPASLEDEHRDAVPWAAPQRLARGGGRVITAAAAKIHPRDLPPCEPVPDRGDRAVQRVRHLAQSSSVGCQAFQHLPVGCSAWGELAHEHMFARAADGTAAVAATASAPSPARPAPQPAAAARGRLPRRPP
jgi:hypothetical protein